MDWNRCLRLVLLQGVGFISAIPLFAQSEGTIGMSCTPAAAGSTASCSVSLSLSGATVNNLAFGVTVSPTGSAPGLTSGTLGFTDSVGGGFASPAGTNGISVVWAGISPALGGSQTLGSVSFTIPAAASTGNTYSVSFTGVSASMGNSTVSISKGWPASVTVPAPAELSITGPSSLANGTVGLAYPGVWFLAVGGTGRYTWSASGLPPGLTFSSDGKLSGTPTQSGSFTPQFTVKDSGSAVTFVILPLLVGEPSSACGYTLAPGSGGFPQSGGYGSVSVTVPSGCLWTAAVSSDAASWITLTSGASGMGNGAVTYQVMSNGGPARTGNLTIGAATLTVYQNGVNLAPAGALPQFATGAGWDTTITIVNLWPTSNRISVSLFDDSGNPVAVPVIFPQTTTTTTQTLSTIERTLNPGAVLIIKTANASSPTSIYGWVQLTSDGNAQASCVFAWTTAGGAQEAVVLSEDRQTTAFILPFDNTGGMRTGIAVANISTQSVTIPVVLRDGAGTQLGTGSISLLPHGHKQLMLDDEYPVTQGRVGTAEFGVPSGAQISVLGIRATPTGAITSVPVLAR